MNIAQGIKLRLDNWWIESWHEDLEKSGKKPELGNLEFGKLPSRRSMRKVTGRLMSQDKKKRNSLPVIGTACLCWTSVGWITSTITETESNGIGISILHLHARNKESHLLLHYLYVLLFGPLFHDIAFCTPHFLNPYRVFKWWVSIILIKWKCMIFELVVFRFSLFC